MLTARDTPADRIAGLDAGADDYLVKPFDFGEGTRKIKRPLIHALPWLSSNTACSPGSSSRTSPGTPARILWLAPSG